MILKIVKHAFALRRGLPDLNDAKMSPCILLAILHAYNSVGMDEVDRDDAELTYVVVNAFFGNVLNADGDIDADDDDDDDNDDEDPAEDNDHPTEHEVIAQ